MTKKNYHVLFQLKAPNMTFKSGKNIIHNDNSIIISYSQGSVENLLTHLSLLFNDENSCKQHLY